MIIAINKHLRQWAHSEKWHIHDSQHLHICLVLAKAHHLPVSFNRRMLWDRMCPKHKAEQTACCLLIPCKKLFTKRVCMIVPTQKRKKKRAFFPQNSNKLREGQMLTSCISFWVKHSGGFRCYWPHFVNLLLCQKLNAIVLLSYKSAYLQTFEFHKLCWSSTTA